MQWCSVPAHKPFHCASYLDYPQLRPSTPPMTTLWCSVVVSEDYFQLREQCGSNVGNKVNECYRAITGDPTANCNTGANALCFDDLTVPAKVVDSSICDAARNI